MPAPAFVVDDRRLIVAWNHLAEEGLGLPASEAIGRPCYEVMPAVDVETGRPCYETCPLAGDRPREGWAFSRILEAPWAASRRARLHCFLLRCLLPAQGRRSLCFIGPPRTPAGRARERVMGALEALYPVSAGASDPKRDLGLFCEAMMTATGADAAGLFIADPETHHLVLAEHRGVAAGLAPIALEPVVDTEFAGVAEQTDVPVVGIRRNGRDSTDWYLWVPVVGDGRTLGVFAVRSQRPRFDLAAAARGALPIAGQLSMFLRWAPTAGGAREAEQTPESTTARLRIHVLGPLRVCLDGQPIPASRFGRSKAIELLKYLVAHRGKPISREALIEFLWPEGDPLHASGNLRVVLHALRHALEPEARGADGGFVITAGEFVFLDPTDRVWVDAEEFARLARSGAELAAQGQRDQALAEYRRAVALYTGEFLADEPYSDWCIVERQRLSEIYLDLLRDLAAELERRGDLPGAIDALRAALRADRGREEFHRQLIRLLAIAGRRDEALRQFEVCRRLLKAELGVQPSPETRRVFAALLAETHAGR